MLVHTYFYNSTQVTKSEMHVINELYRNVTTCWKCEQNKWINIFICELEDNLKTFETKLLQLLTYLTFSIHLKKR